MKRKRHIARTDLPWRTSTVTVCGRPTSMVSFETVPELKTMPSEDRFAMRDQFCQVCRELSVAWPDWDSDPVVRMLRECEASTDRRRRAVERDLRALGELVGRHREEFDELLEGETALAALAGFR